MGPTKENNTTMTVVTALVALLIGVGGGYAIGNNMKDDTDTSVSNSENAMSQEVDGVTVGGAKMVRTLDIVDNAVNAKNVTTLVTAVKAADLVDTLKTAGPFTVFGPSNDAFAKLPAGTVDSLLLPENISALKNILTYHVVAGTYTSADLKVMAQKGETLMTVQGEMLTPVVENNTVKIKDAKDVVVGIETADVISSNGVTHVINTVFSPAN